MFADHGITVLVAEDDPQVSALLRRIMIPLGFRVLVTHTLEDTLATIDQGDILFLDWRLDGDTIVSEIALSRWIESRRGPVCVCSGYVTAELEAKLLTQRAWNVLRKPTGTEVIQSIIIRYGLAVIDMRERETLQEVIERLKAEITRLHKILRLLIGALLATTGLQLLLGDTGQAVLAAIVSIL